MKLFNPLKGQWWNAENKREAYYMTLRVHYRMPALEAWNMLKRNFDKYPEFMNEPMATLRAAIHRDGAHL